MTLLFDASSNFLRIDGEVKKAEEVKKEEVKKVK
jgi:hypothetical protein